MTAPASVLDSVRQLPKHRESWLANATTNAKLSKNETCAFKIERVLKRVRLSLVELSAQTRMRFGQESPYFIPQTFLYKQRTGVTPHICQIVALSDVTGCRFVDWLSIWGFDLRLVLDLQLKIPNKRTIMLTSSPGLVQPSFSSDYSAEQRHQNRYCYAKIGSRDAVLFPVLPPATIVRADRHYSREILKGNSSSEHLWLVEHSMGITCCRIKSVGNSEVILLPHVPPLSPWPLRLSTQVRILGLVDTQRLPHQEIKLEPWHRVREPNRSLISPISKGRMSLSQLLRMSRLRTGLTFREAHTMTLQVAGLLQNCDFGISIGLLSDYEAINRLPRHMAKIITLCVIYGIDPWKLLAAGGIYIHDSAKRQLFTDERSASNNISGSSNWMGESSMVNARFARRQSRSMANCIGESA